MVVKWKDVNDGATFCHQEELRRLTHIDHKISLRAFEARCASTTKRKNKKRIHLHSPQDSTSNLLRTNVSSLVRES